MVMYEEPNIQIIVFDNESIYTKLGNSDDENNYDWDKIPGGAT